jgi:hypothetical protein
VLHRARQDALKARRFPHSVFDRRPEHNGPNCGVGPLRRLRRAARGLDAPQL